jgi:UDP-glucose 4-epimerase
MKVVVTGGAGFIGSHLVDALVVGGHDVVVLDDLSTGLEENVNPAAELFVGSVADEHAVRQVMAGAEVVLHQAALGSVQRSVEQPLTSDLVNTHGTLTVLQAALDAGVRRVVFSSSSSVYGGAKMLPTPETAPLVPRSPYAVTKFAGEQYCRVFSELFGLETVALRYFNVFGPRQRPDSAYAAVIPLFIDALTTGRQPRVHGDGHQSRDFTYVTNVVAANLLAITAPAAVCSGRVYNVAAGRRVSILELLDELGRLTGAVPEPAFGPDRPGDIRHSQADISAAGRDLQYEPVMGFEAGLREAVSWFWRRKSATSPALAGPAPVQRRLGGPIAGTMEATP